MKQKKFNEKCYAQLMKVPRGQITTYSEIARALNTKAQRAVGSAMKKNTNAPNTPCHRVVKSNGDIGEYNEGTQKKIKLLESEGLTIKNNKIQNFKEKLYKF
jgi:methylated-DNA-[protein]-cysteine S-methyltransferase